MAKKKVKSKPHAKKVHQKSSVRNAQRKTSTTKKRNSTTDKNRSGKNKRTQSIRKTNQIRKGKLVSKNVAKSKVQVSKVTRTINRKGVKQKVETTRRKTKGTLTVAKQSRRTNKQLDFGFKKVRSIDKKINLFEEQSGKAIKKQLAKRGGKPPRGIVVVVTDKNGKEAASVSPLTFVVNEKNVKKFTQKFLKELQDGNNVYKERKAKILKKIKRRKKQTRSEALREILSEAEENYGNYDPDNISEISIKFIY